MECSFQKNFCLYERSSVSLITNSKTFSPNTGPQKPFTGNFCHFMSNQARIDRTVILESKVAYFEEEKCLTFMYYMYGNTTGSLTVKLLSIRTDRSSYEKTIFEKVGNQGNLWREFDYIIYFNNEERVSIFFL